MNFFLDAPNRNIKRLQNLLDTSVDATERRTLQKLLAEEKAKVERQAGQANGLRPGKE